MDDNALTKDNETLEEHSASNKTEEKFFFDMNFFEGDEVISKKTEEEDEIPPPPTFSEEDLDAAKASSFQEGKAEGLREASQSREKFIASIIERISQSTSILFEAEIEREKRFEQESVQLSLKIFQQVFPLYQEKYGFDELKKAISDTIAQQEEQSSILAEVHPDYQSDIDSFLQKAYNQISSTPCRFEVQGRDGFNKDQFKLSWKDGGAVRDIDTLATKIHDIVQNVLLLSGAELSKKNEQDAKDSGIQNEPEKTAFEQYPELKDGETIDE